jgi:pyruvate kinase
MNVARLNFSHGDHSTHGQAISNLREALKQRPEKSCALMLDTKGPEIRSGLLKDGKPVDITAGQALTIVTDQADIGDNTKIVCSYPALPTSVSVGSTIFIDGNSLTCEVTEIGEAHVKVTCKNAAKLGERKTMVLPGAEIDLPTLTSQDETDIVDFGIPNGVDFIAASFIRKASDIDHVREVLGTKGVDIKVVSKIENQEGLHNFEDILAASDGIMVCRASLGLEIAPEKVFIAQKWMTEKANLAAKPVIIATQMLDSMVKAPRPSRAEASDVANAVLDGTDCVMLSKETANGDYPINAVSIMAKVCTEAERTLNYRLIFNDLKLYTPEPVSTAESVASAVCSAVLAQKDIQLIVALTDTGKLARMISKYRPEVCILACSTSDKVVQQCNASRGVVGLRIQGNADSDVAIKGAIEDAKSLKLVKVGAKCAVIHGSNEDTPDESNIMKIVDA